MQLFISMFNNPIEYAVAGGIALLMVLIVLRSAMAAEGRTGGWVRAITRPSAKYLFGALFIVWALAFGIGLQMVPHTGADSPYGGLALIALFSGFFIMMGFLWAVIGE